MSRKTFIGRVLSVTNSKVIMSTTDPAHGDAIALQAGAVVLEQARRLQGRVVRFVAEVSEATKCLSNPQFVIGSEFGLQAVAPSAKCDCIRGTVECKNHDGKVERVGHDYSLWRGLGGL